ncbi:AbrB/MazE/SpoVT family DNA-binding domain-containing protein [Candidatus Roizmanbacteria bacterium]|nr:AbrB/MazE/SpoVT family DNA-binding domain-containing protein [Candidatus Roizmanbacteria bacterium]
MQFTTTVTQKGQVTLPKKMRESLNIHEYDKVFVEAGKDHIKIKPAEDILDLAGKFHKKMRKSILKAREYMEKNYKRY